MWFDSHDNRQQLATHLITVGTLTTPISVLRFFEKPWKYSIDWEEFTNTAPEWEENHGLENPDDWAKL